MQFACSSDAGPARAKLPLGPVKWSGGGFAFALYQVFFSAAQNAGNGGVKAP
jgi:hypothetical protein